MFVSENNEDNENYDMPHSEILNTKEATKKLWTTYSPLHLKQKQYWYKCSTNLFILT